MNWKFLAVLIGIGTGTLSFISTWMALGFPTVATRSYVDERLRPLVYQQLRVRRHVNSVDLFQWKQNAVITLGIQIEIDRLEAENRDLDRKLAEMDR